MSEPAWPVTANRPAMPGALLGYTKSGRPIRLIAGGSEPATEPPAAPAGEPPAPPAEPAKPAAAEPPRPGQPAPGQEPPAPAEPPAAEPAGSVEELPPWAQKLLRDTRTEAATNRTRAKEHADELAALKATSQQQLDGIAKALGLKPEDATPEQIAAERDAARAETSAEKAAARATAVELAVFRAAAREGANGDALLDSRAFVAKLAGLDPVADGFGQQVSDLIKAATEEDARYKAAPPLAADPAVVPPAGENGDGHPPAPARSGGEHTTPGGNRQWTAEEAARIGKTDPQAVLKAMNDGLLAGIGIPAPKKR